MSATCDVWPQVGTTVMLASGFVVTAAGAEAALTDEISGLLASARLLTYDPTQLNPNPSPIPREPGGSVLWVNVKEFGAAGDGVTGDYLAIRAAIAALGDGGTLYFPTGRYYIDIVSPYEFDLPSNCVVTGDGDSSVIVHPQSSGTTVGAFNFDGETNVRVTNLRFEWLHAVHFMRGINAIGSSNITVDHCSFACLAPDVEFPEPLGDVIGVRTLYAVLFQDSNNVSVCDCTFYRMQIKGSGNTGCDKALYCRNRFTNPFDIAVSFVAANPAAVLTNCVISDNLVSNPMGSCAFHIGADGEGHETAVLSSVVVSNNVVEGDWENTVAAARVGLTVYCGVETKNIQIIGNTFRNTSSLSLETSTGIRVFADPDKSVDGLKIVNNHVYGFDQAGINVLAQGTNWDISGNELPGRTRGINIQPAANGVSNLVVSNNVVVDCSGITLDSTNGVIKRAVVSNNILQSNRGNFENGVGIRLTSTGNELQALVQGNRCYDTNGTFSGQFFGIQQAGTSGVFNVQYVDNDCRDNRNTGCSILTGSAIGSGNRGGGFPSAAPTAGTWDVGARVQNHLPAVGQPKGWVCTVAGTPGTWVSEGVL